MASDYREEFKKDIVIDLIGYRRSGHNEADDPSSTQPVMYKKIKQHPSVLKSYKDKLIQNNDITSEEFDEFKKSYRSSIEKDESVALNLSKIKNDDLWFEWDQFIDARWDENTDTTVKQDQLIDDARTIADIPSGFVFAEKSQKYN